MSSQVAKRPIAVVAVGFNSERVLPGFWDTLPAGMGASEWAPVMVDNGSSDRTAEVGRAAGAEVIETGVNVGFGAALNRGLEVVHREADVLVVNPDVRLHPETAPRLQARLRTRAPVRDGEPDLEIGIAAPRLVDEAGETQPSLRNEPSPGRALAEALLGVRRAGRLGWGEAVIDSAAYARATVADWISGAALMISRECLNAGGAWDETFFLYSEDTEYALRARDRGFAACLVPEAAAIHLGGSSRTDPNLWKLLAVNKLVLYRRRYGRRRAMGFRAACLVRELRLALSGNRPSRAAARALLAGPW